MKLYVSPRAPNPRRVQMFIAEKGIRGIEEVVVDLVGGEHRSSDHRARSPLAKVPVPSSTTAAISARRARSAAI